jgi:raffinose synthase
VQVDCQAGVGLVGSVTGGGTATARRFHKALEDSMAVHFPGNHAINCMCHSTENIYQMRDSAVIRASDDFYPREPASSAPHVAACAYNSLFLSVLCQPDWDMFQSAHPAARLHACARAVSGGAVYVSDKVGRHDFDILRQLVLKDGSVLRALRPGLPTQDCIFQDPLRDGLTALKVRTRALWRHIKCSAWHRVVMRLRVCRIAELRH